MIKFRKKDIFEMMFAFAIVLNGQSMWSKMLNVQGWFSNILILVLAFSVLGCVRTSREREERLQVSIFKLMILGVYLAMYVFLKPSNIKELFKLYLIILLISWFIFRTKDISGVLEKYKNMVILIAAFSLFFWIFGSVFSIVKPTGQIYSTWTGTNSGILVNSYCNIYFQFQRINILSLNGYRNIAFWCEAPMAAFHFSFAFLLEIFNKKNLGKRNIIILVLAILSTFSMTGYVVIFFGIVFKYFVEETKQSLRELIKILAIPIVIIIAGCVLGYIYKLKAFSGAGLARLNDFAIGYQVWKKNFWFGVGYGNYDEIKNMMPLWRSTNTGFSNAITLILAYGGLYWGVMYVYSFIRGEIISLKKKEMYKFSIITIFMIIFCITNIPYIYLTLLIVLASLEGDTKFV